MVSTYSNLKIQLMATGENATTWGDVTNTNLGTALEEAITATAVLTFASADVTLTLTDSNLTQSARRMRLRCAGTTGGSARNLIVPAIEKLYIVQNGCADNITVKTPAGTGIVVTPGKTMWVYSDGTNVVDVVTRLSSLSLGTALAATEGGTGLTSYAIGDLVYASGATTLAKLADVATGNTLLSGGVGVAPSWGKVGLTTHVTGALPIINGGTNLSTTPTNGQVLIGNGTGYTLATLTQGSGVTITNGAGTITIAATASMVYPGAGIAVSTGSAWGTSLTAPSGTVVGTSDTQTLTNKRVNPRVGSVTSNTTITPTADTSDQYTVTALASATTFAAPSGTPVDGQKLMLRIKDNGTGWGLSWTTSAGGYRVVSTTLPTTTVATKTLYVGCIYNSADGFWDVVAVAQQA